MNNKMKIKEITSYDEETKTIIDDLLKVLVKKSLSISTPMLKELISLDNSHLFFVFDEDENCMGMLTLGIYISPTGKKASIEDVVVGEKYQGRGFGKQLISFAIEFAIQKGVSLLSLTSNPSKVAANKLYLKQGFERKETNVYKMNI